MRTLGLFALPLLAMACGGQVDSVGGSHNNDNNNHPQTHLPTGTMVGSFDLKFAKVTATSTFSGASYPEVTPPSQDGNARLDVDSDSASIATVTSRWGSPAILATTVTSSSLALKSFENSKTGALEVIFAGDTSFGYATDRWSAIKFGRTSDGSFDGTFTATGDEEIFEGDEGFEATLTGSGTISPDSTAPDWRQAPVTDALLPWEPVRIQFAEPSPTPFDHILSLDAASIHGSVIPDADTSTATALLTSWNVTSASLSATQFADPAGNSVGARSIPIVYTDVGSPQAAFSFDGGVSPVKWDDASLISFLSSDGSCESGGCAKVGPLNDHGCTIPNAGIAGVLQHDASHPSTLFVRYRILVGLDPSSSSGQPLAPDGAVFSVETATPGVAPTSQQFGFVLDDLKTIPSTFGMTQATDWATASIPLAASSSLGFGIRFGSSNFCGGPIFSENSTIVLIDSITTD